ncbi:calcyclin-binding protein isoform X1 [Macrotis lagotis]|uniref:calcyclin-binding protein isoform X1 n=1 Tax=Macrotis lagotis TaxID=92651 RepID=UPI003D6983E3
MRKLRHRFQNWTYEGYSLSPGYLERSASCIHFNEHGVLGLFIGDDLCGPGYRIGTRSQEDSSSKSEALKPACLSSHFCKMNWSGRPLRCFCQESLKWDHKGLNNNHYWIRNFLILRKDLEEVKELLGKASRKRIRDVLTAEKTKLETEIKHKTKQKGHEKGETIDNEKPAAVVAPISTGYTVKINNYGWDQSDKYVKIYITLNGVHQVPTENVQVQFKERSFEVLVKNLNGKNYSMTVNNLLKPISVEASSRKIKTDTVLVLCKKKQEQKWDYLTQVEKVCKEKEKSSFDNDTDPSEGLMNVLKKIYEDGDDEMKRTINKAWVESREKQAKGENEF